MKYAAAAGDRLGNEVVVTGVRQVDVGRAYVHSDKRPGVEMTRHKTCRSTSVNVARGVELKLQMNVR